MSASALIGELERIADLGLPEWSEKLTDRTDPVLRELDELLEHDPVARREVVSYLQDPASGAVKRWLDVLFRPDLALGEKPVGAISCAGITVPTSPAVFLAHDAVSVPERRLRKMSRPWEHAPGWFHGRPQEAGHEWPTGRDGRALDFFLQFDLSRAARDLPGFGSVGLPADHVLQLFVDLDTEVGPMDHRCITFPAGAGGRRSAKPPRGSDVNDAVPSLINPVGALTFPPEAGGASDSAAPDAVVRGLLQAHADAAPYELNLFRDVDDDAAPDDVANKYVPMARLGGFPVADGDDWCDEAAGLLGCDRDDVVVLFDGPVDVEPGPVDDPARSRIMVLVDRMWSGSGDASRTVAFGY